MPRRTERTPPSPTVALAGEHCLERLAELSAYLDGDLSPARCRTIERHLDRCPCCEHFAESLKRAVAVCRASGIKRLPRDVRARALDRIAELLAAMPAPTPPPPARRRARAV